MLLYKPLDITQNDLASAAFKVASAAALRGNGVILLYTPHRGWHGWESFTDPSEESWERMVRLTLADGSYAYYPLCQIQAALEVSSEGMPDVT